MAMGPENSGPSKKTRGVRPMSCLRLRGTFKLTGKGNKCQDGKRFEGFLGRCAKGSIGAGGLSVPWPCPREPATAPAVRSIGCRTRLDTKQSRGATVV